MDAAEYERRQNFKAAIEAHFRAHPCAWIPAADLMKIGGSLAWRTRVADARKTFKAEGGSLENRQQRVMGSVMSEYRFVPYQPLGRDASTKMPTYQPELFIR